MAFNVERLSEVTYKLVQDDGYGQYPFLYAIVGSDKVVLIDTGVGKGGLRQLLDSQINPGGLPYLVICTHIHFGPVSSSLIFLAATQLTPPRAVARRVRRDRPRREQLRVRGFSHLHGQP